MASQLNGNTNASSQDMDLIANGHISNDVTRHDTTGLKTNGHSPQDTGHMQAQNGGVSGHETGRKPNRCRPSEKVSGQNTGQDTGHRTNENGHIQQEFQPNYDAYRLSSPPSEIKSEYDVIVIGSGYGGAIAASRSARCGQRVCVLERGKEWMPGEFPEKFNDARKEVTVTSHKLKLVKPVSGGSPTKLFDLNLSPGLAVLQGSGLGGTSLINANAALMCEPGIFKDPIWPRPLIDDLDYLTGECQQRVNEMLKPTTYPSHYPQPPKMAAFKKVATRLAEIEDLDPRVLLKRAQLYVNFEDKVKNHVGVPQPACIGCGNCCGGCNTGAKNTVNMNYLPDAKIHGAQLFTEVEVRAITRDPEDTSRWLVSYSLHSGSSTQEEKVIKAKTVILGAGSLGSTGILLRSKERGLSISSMIGKRFSANGGSLGFSYNGEEEVRPRGVKINKIRKTGKCPGPCVTTVIDMRNRPGTKVEDSFILEDGTPPSSMGKFWFKSMLGFESMHSGEATCKDDKLGRLRRRLSGKSFDNSLTFLVTSSQNDSGHVQLGKDGRVWIDYPNAGGTNFQTINEHMRRGGEALKGTFIPNPMWNSLVNKMTGLKGLITVHPLGGCPMSETGAKGVVNHAGQVYAGDSDELHDGLYVVDGAVIPRSLGANPSLVIAMVAERCMSLMAEQLGWGTIDYSFKT